LLLNSSLSQPSMSSSAATPTLVVRNTFICAVGVEELSPCRMRQRAKTHEVSSSTLLLDEQQGQEGGALAMQSAGRRADLALTLEAGEAEVVSAAVAEIEASLPALSFHPEGASLVRRALEVASSSEQKALMAAMAGMVCEAARSPHAHEVLEQIVICRGAEGVQFIVEELSRLGGREASSNLHACPVCCRLLAAAPAALGVVALVDEALGDDPADLCCRKFGHLLAVAVVCHGLPRQAGAIVASLRGNPQRFARHRFASKVYEAALRACPPALGEGLARDLMEQPGAVASMACHNFGVRVVRALLDLPAPAGYARQARHYLCRASKRVCKDKYGFALMCELGLAAPLPPHVAAAGAAPFGGA